jgi:hypothetical protein
VQPFTERCGSTSHHSRQFRRVQDNLVPIELKYPIRASTRDVKCRLALSRFAIHPWPHGICEIARMLVNFPLDINGGQFTQAAIDGNRLATPAPVVAIVAYDDAVN